MNKKHFLGKGLFQMTNLEKLKNPQKQGEGGVPVEIYGNRNGMLSESDEGDVKYRGLVSKVRYGYGVRVENLVTGKRVFFPRLAHCFVETSQK